MKKLLVLFLTVCVMLTSSVNIFAKDTTNEVKIGETEYATLSNAIESANDGDVIEIIANISDETITVNKDVSIKGTKTGYTYDYTLTDVKLTSTSGKKLNIDSIKFAGDSYINTSSCGELIVKNCYADVTPTRIKGRSAFIVLGATEATTGLNLKVNNNTIMVSKGTNTSGDTYGAAIFGWEYIKSAIIKDNILGSYNTPYNFIGIKLMNFTDKSSVLIENNTVYGSNKLYSFEAFDLYQNNSRANTYHAVLNNNKVINVNSDSSTYDFVFAETEANTGAFGPGHAMIDVMENNTLNNKNLNIRKDEYTWIQKDAKLYIGTNIVKTGDKYSSGVFELDAEDASAAKTKLNEYGITFLETSTLIELFSQNNEKVFILGLIDTDDVADNYVRGGCYGFDPTVYLCDDYITILNDDTSTKTTYPYKVIPRLNNDTLVDGEQNDNNSSISANVSSNNAENVKSAIDNTYIDLLLEAKALAVDENVITEEVVNDAEQVALEESIDLGNLEIHVFTYLQQEVVDVKDNESKDQVESFTVDITPMYVVKAVDKTKLTTNDYTGYALTDTKVLNIDRIVKIKAYLPDKFVSSPYPGDKQIRVYVKHKGNVYGLDSDTLNNGAIYIQSEGTSENKKYFVEFYNPDGFSEFEFSLKELTPDPKPTNKTSYKDESCEAVIGKDWTWDNDLGVCKLKGYRIVNTETK